MILSDTVVERVNGKPDLRLLMITRAECRHVPGSFSSTFSRGTCNICSSKFLCKLHYSLPMSGNFLKTSFCIITVSYIFVIPLVEEIPPALLIQKDIVFLDEPAFYSKFGLYVLIKLARRAFPGARHNAAGRAANRTDTATLDRE